MTDILDISDIPLKLLFDGIPWGKNKDTCSDRLIYIYIYHAPVSTRNESGQNGAPMGTPSAQISSNIL